MNRANNQSGFVAIFTVIFFMILISILTLGFIRIMIAERQQSQNNDQSATALNAAEAGVEDGKRFLLYCNQQLATNGPNAGVCQTALASEACPGVFDSSASIRQALGIDAAREADGAIRVSNSNGTEQHYTCLTVKTQTDNYVANLAANQSDMIPLKSSTGQFSTIELSWHLTSNSGQRPVIAYPASATNLPTQQQWSTSGNNYPAYMRAQFMQHATANFTLAGLDDSSRAAFIVPAGTNPATTRTQFDINADDVHLGNKAQPEPARCLPAGTNSGYACTIRIQVGTVNTNTTSAYLRLTALYGPTEFSVRLLDNSGAPVQLDGTQPLIDSTGRSNDVFRRVQTRVRLDSSTFYPNYSLESGDDICKNFMVTSNPADYANVCSGAVGGVTTCSERGPNLAPNPSFASSAGNGPGVAAGAGFTSDLPNRGFDTYPDDLGLFGTSTGWTGGFSLQQGNTDNSFYFHPNTGSPGDLVGRPFPGDNTTNPAVPGSNTYFYSNPNQNINQPRGTVSTFTGTLWASRNPIPVDPNSLYDFSAYFDNLIASPNGSTDPDIELSINGVSFFRRTIPINPDEWTRMTLLYQTGPTETSVNIAINDYANDTFGDDFAMTQVGFYKCITP